jgi:hypothetical protein
VCVVALGRRKYSANALVFVCDFNEKMVEKLPHVLLAFILL